MFYSFFLILPLFKSAAVLKMRKAQLLDHPLNNDDILGWRRKLMNSFGLEFGSENRIFEENHPGLVIFYRRT